MSGFNKYEGPVKAVMMHIRDTSDMLYADRYNSADIIMPDMVGMAVFSYDDWHSFVRARTSLALYGPKVKMGYNLEVPMYSLVRVVTPPEAEEIMRLVAENAAKAEEEERAKKEKNKARAAKAAATKKKNKIKKLAAELGISEDEVEKMLDKK